MKIPFRILILTTFCASLFSGCAETGNLTVINGSDNPVKFATMTPAGDGSFDILNYETTLSNGHRIVEVPAAKSGVLPVTRSVGVDLVWLQFFSYARNSSTIRIRGPVVRETDYDLPEEALQKISDWNAMPWNWRFRHSDLGELLILKDDRLILRMDDRFYELRHEDGDASKQVFQR